MATGAFWVRVRAKQGKFGLDRVIERPIGPRDGIVTILAYRAESRLMVVVVAMAIYADNGYFRITLGGVTSVAFRLAVFAEERKAREIMVKDDIDVPCPIVVALFAIDA
jgi:hypothetical protein